MSLFPNSYHFLSSPFPLIVLFYFISSPQSTPLCLLLCCLALFIFVWITVQLLSLSTSFLSFSSSYFTSPCLKKSSLSTSVSPLHPCFIEVIASFIFFSLIIIYHLGLKFFIYFVTYFSDKHSLSVISFPCFFSYIWTDPVLVPFWSLLTLN